MAGNKGSKLVLLYAYKILMEETDEQHPMTPAMLIERLGDYGYECERKTVYRHIEALSEFGVDILRSDAEPRGCYVASRDFEMPELRLLVDAVQSSRFISLKKSQELIEKLGNLASLSEVKQIKKGLHMRGISKTDNELVYYTLDALYRAIAANRRICFRYFEYTSTKEKHYRNDGEAYVVSPYAVVWNDEKYYLHAYHEKYDAISSFRVDRMEGAEVTDLPRLKSEEYALYDPSERSKTAFDQFSGETVTVVADFDNRMAGAVIDRFGNSVQMYPLDDEHFTAHFSVEVSPRFLSWLFGFGTMVRVRSPRSLVERYVAELEAVKNKYKDE